ncbi:hypothetical protein KC324_g19050 [Hortaea werneckii]|nr:hypothetical protein KC324_g19050 [Hortaea werneckii]
MPSPPPSLEEASRPESVVGELPSSSNWNSERSPSKQASTFHAASSDAPQPALRTVESSQPRRSSGPKSFSLPLRVNPPNHNCPPRRSDTGPFNPAIDNKKARELRPSISTPEPELSQKLPAYPTPTPSLQPLASPKAGNNFRQPSRAPSGNLSLFPPSSPALSQPGTASPNDSPGLSPHSPHPGAAPGNHPRALRRPTSMQVRSNPAPFLQTMRAGGGSPSAAATSSRSFTAPPPIRNLKPSRSSTNIISPIRRSTDPAPLVVLVHEPVSLPSSSPGIIIKVWLLSTYQHQHPHNDTDVDNDNDHDHDEETYPPLLFLPPGTRPRPPRRRLRSPARSGAEGPAACSTFPVAVLAGAGTVAVAGKGDGEVREAGEAGEWGRISDSFGGGGVRGGGGEDGCEGLIGWVE